MKQGIGRHTLSGLGSGVALCAALLVIGCVDSEGAGFGEGDDDADGDAPVGDGDTAVGDGDTVEPGDGDTGDDPLSACGVPPIEGKIVLGYLPSWSNFPVLAASLDYDALTHVALAFTNPTGPGQTTELAFVADEDVHNMVTLAHEKGVKVIASIGGAAESDVINQLIQPATVDAYIEELAGYLEKFDLDGVDVDIEGGEVDATYGPFVSKLAARIRPEGKTVSAAVGQWFQDGIVDEALFCFDFLNEMSYDAAGGWTGPEEHASQAFARARARYWQIQRSYPAERIVIGVPFYGYCWGSGCPSDGSQISFAHIEELYPDQLDGDWIMDEENNVTINFNGTASIQSKAAFSRDYGGIMLWDLNQDGSENQLMEALKAGL